MNSGLLKPYKNLERERIQGEGPAIETHRAVGSEVREAIRRIGGTMPESLPVEEPIKKVIATHEEETKRIDAAISWFRIQK